MYNVEDNDRPAYSPWKRRFFAISGVLLVIAIGYFSYRWYRVKHLQQFAPTGGQSSPSQTLPDNIKEFPASSYPPGISPKYLPLEEGVEVLQSYEAEEPDRTYQSTYSYISKRTVVQNKSLYSSYMSKYDWNVIDDPLASSTQVSLLGVSKVESKNRLLVDITEHDGKVVVTIHLVVRFN